jgi:hypothetical protein
LFLLIITINLFIIIIHLAINLIDFYILAIIIKNNYFLIMHRFNHFYIFKFIFKIFNFLKLSINDLYLILFTLIRFILFN